MVEMEDVIEHLRRAASRNASPDSSDNSGQQSGGFDEPAVATANATAAFAELDLQRPLQINPKLGREAMCKNPTCQL